MIPKKKARKIKVDGKGYLYLCKYGGSRLHQRSGRFMWLTLVEDSKDHGQLLKCLLESTHPSALAEPGDEWMHPEHKVSLTPKDVQKLVRYALTNGWRPSLKGEPFVLTTGPALAEYRVRVERKQGLLSDDRANARH